MNDAPRVVATFCPTRQSIPVARALRRPFHRHDSFVCSVCFVVESSAQNKPRKTRTTRKQRVTDTQPPRCRRQEPGQQERRRKNLVPAREDWTESTESSKSTESCLRR